MSGAVPVLSRSSRRFRRRRCQTSKLFHAERFFRIISESASSMCEYAVCAAGQHLTAMDRCSRLGLTPIAYLWERNQEELLSEMVSAGMESVLVKVAGAG